MAAQEGKNDAATRGAGTGRGRGTSTNVRGRARRVAVKTGRFPFGRDSRQRECAPASMIFAGPRKEGGKPLRGRLARRHETARKSAGAKRRARSGPVGGRLASAGADSEAYRRSFSSAAYGSCRRFGPTCASKSIQACADGSSAGPVSRPPLRTTTVRGIARLHRPAPTVVPLQRQLRRREGWPAAAPAGRPGRVRPSYPSANNALHGSSCAGPEPSRAEGRRRRPAEQRLAEDEGCVWISGREECRPGQGATSTERRSLMAGEVSARSPRCARRSGSTVTLDRSFSQRSFIVRTRGPAADQEETC